MPKEQPPFTYVVAFTVSPLWTADGFTLSDERVHDMLWRELGAATHDECAARVISAPPSLKVMRCQGYGPKTPGAGNAVREYLEGVKGAAQLPDALTAAIDLLDSVAFVAKEGDTVEPLRRLRALRELLSDGLALENNSQAE